ncbi:uncharacterized protein LOC126876607 isoform X2 [Bombus huntii]|uniref:uncharacterized protein LOC126872957 isoform X7 n=1 Tax=Bombus huntii TaxID=85661 RepID=UPI0021AAFD5D|nr:uncharacterized protein LOC126872957 isoform X7 [Bombus huntii]XP_050495478.1 uncharacterized protein LOC126876607 isoform X2 [Bombus huntii]
MLFVYRWIASVFGFVSGLQILYSSTVRIAIHVLPSVVQRMVDEFAISSVHTYKNNSTHSMLRHLPGSFPQRHPILRYALDTYYGCLQSSYICGYKEILKTTDSLISEHSAPKSG